MINLKNIVECIMHSGNKKLTLIHKNGSKIKFYGKEARRMFYKINGPR